MESEIGMSSKFKDYVRSLHAAVRADQPREDEIYALYQGSEEIAKEFSSQPWPSADAISDLVRGDEIFLRLYTEMAFQVFFKNKHVRATMQDRAGSWENYSALFTLLINDEDGRSMSEAGPCSKMTIVGKWAFDIIYEFVYQFQEACQYREKAATLPESEYAEMVAHANVWAVDKVFNYLHKLVRVSKVREVLEAAKRPEGEGPPVSYPSKLHYQLGYFALVGLNRLEVLLGDFGSALKVAQPLLNYRWGGPEHLLSTNLISQVSLYYHIGLCNIMMRRYKDAIGAFVTILDVYYKHLDALRQRHQQDRAQAAAGGTPPKPADYDVGVAKLVDKLVTMLVIVRHLCPGHTIPEHINAHLYGEKNKDKMRQVMTGNADSIASLFIHCAPKFITPAPDLEDLRSGKVVSAPYGGIQGAVFRDEVTQMLDLVNLRSYMKLYSSITVHKLSGFTQPNQGPEGGGSSQTPGMSPKSPEQVRDHLIQFKYKLMQMESAAASAAAGGDSASSGGALDLHYYLSDDMVHIDEPERESRQEVSRAFKVQIGRLEDLARSVRNLSTSGMMQH